MLIGNQKIDVCLLCIIDLQCNFGEYCVGFKQQKGQCVVVDYYMELQIIINDLLIGGVVGVVGGLLGNSVIVVLVGSVRLKVLVVMLMLFDVCLVVQIVVVEGSLMVMNYGVVLVGFGGGVGGGLVGFFSMLEGKVMVVVFIDVWNKMVVVLCSYKVQDVKGGLGCGGQFKVN